MGSLAPAAVSGGAGVRDLRAAERSASANLPEWSEPPGLVRFRSPQAVNEPVHQLSHHPSLRDPIRCQEKSPLTETYSGTIFTDARQER